MKQKFHMHPGVGWSATTPFYYTLQHLNRYVTTGVTKEIQYWALAARENTFDFNRYRNKNLDTAYDNSHTAKIHPPPLAEELRKKVFDDGYLQYFYSSPFSIEKYVEYFLLLDEYKGDYAAVGDFSTYNVDIPDVFLCSIAEKLLEHFDVKVTITFADPITRFYYEVGRLCGRKQYGAFAALGKQQKLFKSYIDRRKFESTDFDRHNVDYAQTYNKYCKAFGKDNVLPIIMEEFWEPKREKEQKERLSEFIGYRIDKIHPNFFWPLSHADDTYLLDQSNSLKEPLTPELIEYAKEPMKHFYDEWLRVLPMPESWNYD
tara:strand:+ start:35444 stop:36394 length:951 start_codon:yes stop_codon:yes gene_type:complete